MLNPNLMSNLQILHPDTGPDFKIEENQKIDLFMRSVGLRGIFRGVGGISGVFSGVLQSFGEDFGRIWEEKTRDPIPRDPNL